MAGRSKVRFIVKWLVVLIVVGGGAFLLFAGTNHSSRSAIEPEANSPDPPLRRVQVLELIPRPVSETITLPGTVEAIEDIDLAAGIAGSVEWIGVKEGTLVKADQLLFQIDQRSRRARVEDAGAAYDLAAKNLERTRGLQETGIVSVEDYDNAATQLKRAKASLNLAQTELSLSLVKAPVHGFVDRIDVDQGEYANEGEVLAHLVAIDTVKVVIGTPERDVKAVSEQNSASVYIDALGTTFTGQIEHVAYAADPQTNTFETTILIDNPEHVIRPGMVARATIVTAHYDAALSVPLFSIVQTLQGSIVFVEKDGVVHSVPVALGGLGGDKVTVLDGVRAGDRVVVVGQRDIADGQAVEVVSPSDPGVVVQHL